MYHHHHIYNMQCTQHICYLVHSPDSLLLLSTASIILGSNLPHDFKTVCLLGPVFCTVFPFALPDGSFNASQVYVGEPSSGGENPSPIHLLSYQWIWLDEGRCDYLGHFITLKRVYQRVK